MGAEPHVITASSPSRLLGHNVSPPLSPHTGYIPLESRMRVQFKLNLKGAAVAALTK